MTVRSLHQEYLLYALTGRRCYVRSNQTRFLIATLLMALPWAFSQPSQAAGNADRVALLLAVEEYSHYAKSAIDSGTVSKMGAALKAQGFSVDVVTNANNAVVRATLRDFASKAENARVAIVVLAGHGVSSGGRSYLLPSNSEIRRASDLLSRGVAVSSVAQIVGRAKHGALFFFMTVPDISSALQSISARPAIEGPSSENVVVVYSTSDKVPVSRVGNVSRQAAADFADAASETPLMMETLVGSASAGDVGKVIGEVADLDLSKGPEPEPPPAAAAAQPSKEEIEARREAEKRAKDAEERAKAAEARAREAEARARLESERAREAEQSAAAAASRGEPETAPAPRAETEEPPPRTAEVEDVEALKLVEALLGRSKKKLLQRKLRDLGFYNGPIDAIFADITRQAIKDYQTDLGASATGYLTPSQIQVLIEG